MPIPITPERAARRAAIADALRDHGPQTSRQIYTRCPDMPDITECCRLIGEMRKVGEIHTEGRTHWSPDQWIVRKPNGQACDAAAQASPPEIVLPANGHHIDVELATGEAEPQAPEAPSWELLPDEREALQQPGDVSLADKWPALLIWYSSEGEMRIGLEGDVSIVLMAAHVAELAAFMKRVGVVA